jgi:hypothetical protein
MSSPSIGDSTANQVSKQYILIKQLIKLYFY